MDNDSDSLISQNESRVHADADEIPLFVFSLNTSAEAKVLSNLDLLGLIFSHFIEKSSSDKRKPAPNRGRRHLLRVGLTCKAFFDPAMSQLWYEMDDFLPMLRLIPKVELKGGVYTATRVIIETDIQRLQFYGQWIRHIQIFFFTEKVSGHIYSAIARYMLGKCLFPALKSLYIHSFTGIPLGNLEILPLLASSPLSTVEIKRVTKGCRVHLSTFLHEISRLHSAENHPVSTLYLGGEIGTSTLPYFQGFAGISKLTLKHQDTKFCIEDLRSLAKHPLLSVLELELSWDEIGIKPSPNSVVYTFQRMQTLALSGHAVHVLGILRCIYGECLSRVNLNFYGLGPDPPTDVLRACVERCTTMTPSLLDLQLTLPSTMILPKDLFSTPWGPQLYIRSLQIKSRLVDRPLFQSLFQDDEDWSDLEVLKLESHATQFPTSSSRVVDLVALPLLCASFPKLHTLEIYLCYPDTNAAVIEALLRSQMRDVEQTNPSLVNLKILFLDPSKTTPFTIRDITLAMTTSRFFNHFFPNLQHLDISHHQQYWKDWSRAVVEMTMNKGLTQ